MHVHHHVRFLLAGTALLAGVVLVSHALSSQPAPGRFLTWAGTVQSTSTATPAPVTAPALPRATPGASPDGGPLSMLQAPLTTILQQLNGDTKTTANGEYSILQEIENGLRDRVDQFLQWVTGRR